LLRKHKGEGAVEAKLLTKEIEPSMNAFYGPPSWNREKRTGYKVIRARLQDGVPTGEYEDFMTGFVVNTRSARVFTKKR
jgi:hypothetical protein